MVVAAGTMAVAVIGMRAGEVGRRREGEEPAQTHGGPFGSQCWRPTFQLAKPAEY